MAIEWLAGNRLRGTTAERPSASLQSPSVGGWVELGRTTLGSSNATIDVSSIPDKRYYQIVWHTSHTGSWNQPGLRLGNGTIDTGSNYAERYNFDGGSDSTNSPNTYHVQWANAAGPNTPLFGCMYISNLSSKEKLGITHVADQNTAGSGTAPRRSETVFKWVNTSNVLDRLEFNNKGSGTFNSGSEIVVLGWDPTDTHTTNFWEELASVDLSGGSADVLSSGTISAKRYLWVQFYVKKSGSIVPEVSFNDSTANEYAYRFSDNGASDGTVQVNKSAFRTSTDDTNSFVNMFIINNSSTEKLAIVHSSDVTTTGAGAAPSRREIVAKWTGSSQITKIDIDNVSSGNFDTASTMKVWGAD